jgi:hypothetical protein
MIHLAWALSARLTQKYCNQIDSWGEKAEGLPFLSSPCMVPDAVF